MISCSLMARSRGESMLKEGEWLTSSSQGLSSESSMMSYLRTEPPALSCSLHTEQAKLFARRFASNLAACLMN